MPELFYFLVELPSRTLNKLRYMMVIGLQGLLFRFADRIEQRRRARRRALTDLTEMPKSATARNERRSMFLSGLPLETRQKIYAEYYDDDVFHVMRTARGKFKCKNVAYTDHRNWRYFREGDSRVVQQGLLELPLSCRQM